MSGNLGSLKSPAVRRPGATMNTYPCD